MNDRDAARRAIALIDLTELGEKATTADVRALCVRAPGTGSVPNVAAVCVWPGHAALACGLVKPHDIKVAAVVNFPSGNSAPHIVLDEVRDALSSGADEIDLVMPYRALLLGQSRPSEAMIISVKAALPPGRRLKVILETGAYSDQKTVRFASDLAIAAGADFIKTSTGKIAVGATLQAARTMLEAIRASGRAVGFKPAGGIRTLADARAYLALADEIMGSGWATAETFRFGASGLLGALAGLVTGAGIGSPSKGY